jgi:lysophospholipid acyltransferase (LPLAT)-like uncharacterized protein
MKIRNPWVIKWVGLLGGWLIRVYFTTLCVRYRSLGRNANPRQKARTDRYIYAFWHETVFLPCAGYARRNILCLISQHADGEIIAQVCRHAGWGVVRGSTSRGGVEALRRMIRLSERYSFAVLPDGPRGPRRHVELGLIYLAARTGLPLVLAGIGYDRPWRMPTWDRFAVPRPWSRAVLLTSDPITVPPNLSRAEMEECRRRTEETLNALTVRAEKLAES